MLKVWVIKICFIFVGESFFNLVVFVVEFLDCEVNVIFNVEVGIDDSGVVVILLGVFLVVGWDGGVVDVDFGVSYFDVEGGEVWESGG